MISPTLSCSTYKFMLISIFADTAHTPGYAHENKRGTSVDSTAKILAWQEEKSLGGCARVER